MPDSWQLKISRAEKHLLELERHVRLYQRGNFYRTEVVGPPKPNATKWAFRLEFTQDPDPQIP